MGRIAEAVVDVEPGKHGNDSGETGVVYVMNPVKPMQRGCRKRYKRQ